MFIDIAVRRMEDETGELEVRKNVNRNVFKGKLSI